MNDKLIMKFQVAIDPEKISKMEKKDGKVTIIPFEASVESDLFCGKTVPGAVDVQVTNAAGIRHMCAKYMFTGRDRTGEMCHLYVENNGYFERNHSPSPFEACPVFMTDSKVLAPYLESAHFRSEGWSTPDGVEIRIYDVSIVED